MSKIAKKSLSREVCNALGAPVRTRDISIRFPVSGPVEVHCVYFVGNDEVSRLDELLRRFEYIEKKEPSA